MKLHKKVAACLLAAAMAIFMMTACGNDSAPAIVNGVTYKNNVAPVASVDSDSIKEQGTITAENSRYIAFLKKRDTEKSQYVKVTQVNYKDGARVYGWQIDTARTERYYYQWAQGDRGNPDITFLEKKDGSFYHYRFIEDGGNKYAVGYNSGEYEWDDYTRVWLPSGTLTSATVTVNGETYYAEISHDGGSETIACFRPDQPVPTYVFRKTVERDFTYVYNEVIFGSDNGTCAQALAGCDVYTFDDNDNLVDKDGNTYVATKDANGNYKITKDGEDVTDKFQWLLKN